MIKKIINPVTRISGFLELEIFIESNKVVDVKSSGLLFRGFEIMLKGRNPFDAIYFTERICGICSTAHAVAASLALENALQIVPSEQEKILRNLVHCCEFLQNHLRHFYFYTLPDFVLLPQEQSLFKTDITDYRLPKSINDCIAAHYFQAIDMSRAAHEMLAIFGGKAPHNHGIFAGGISVSPTIDKISKFKSLLNKIKTFIEEAMIPDLCKIGEYYSEYFQMGKGYGNLLSYGLFDDITDLPNLYVEPSVLIEKQIRPLDKEKIHEYLNYSWYKNRSPQEPSAGITEPETDKENAYSWVKAPRYADWPCEVGPLARMILSGEYRNGISMMDRTIARALEAKKLTEVIELLLENIQSEIVPQTVYNLPVHAEGVGLTDTTRGALGHWLKIDDKALSHYQVITPSSWNLSPRDEKGLLGVVEQALLGTPIEQPEYPVEIGRIVRSFDPCISCATHVITANNKKIIQLA